MDSRYYTQVPGAIGQETAAREFMSRVYGWMGLGLALTAIVSMLTLQSETLLRAVVSNRLLYFGLIIGEFGLVIYLSARISRMSVGTAMGAFVAYAAAGEAIPEDGLERFSEGAPRPD